MLAIVWVVQIGSITRTSACSTARSTFSCADAASGSSSATSAARTRIIMFSPSTGTLHILCDGRAIYTPVHNRPREVDGSDADGIGIRSPQSTSPGGLPPRNEYAVSRSGRVFGQKAGIVMRANLHHRAANTYSGQWPRAFAGESRGVRPVHCPEWPLGARRYPQALEDESPRFRVRVERPDRALDLGIGYFGRIALQRPVRIDVDHLLGDRSVGRHEMVGR